MMMNKIIEYNILSSTKNASLTEKVTEYISYGWQPYWSVYLDKNGVENQAIVRYEDKKPAKKAKKHED